MRKEDVISVRYIFRMKVEFFLVGCIYFCKKKSHRLVHGVFVCHQKRSFFLDLFHSF